MSLPEHLIRAYLEAGLTPPRRMIERYEWLAKNPFARDLLAIESTNS